MNEIFSETGKKVLESLTFTKTLYAFDFDGTLSAIVAKPESAQANPVTEALLTKLTKLVPVAILSGRSVRDLKSRLEAPVKHLIGNHGLEGLGAKKKSIEYANKSCRAWVKQFGVKSRTIPSLLGVDLEDKTYSLALHYRRSRNRRKARAGLFKLIQELQPPPRVIHGKCVLNLVPAGGPHKGVALLELMLSLDVRCAMYIGDDDTDEDVFALPDSRIISIRVGKKKSSQARFYVNRQSEINRLLRFIIKLHDRESGS